MDGRRNPPRFVPTLTTVIEAPVVEPPAGPPPAPADEPPQAFPSASAADVPDEPAPVAVEVSRIAVPPISDEEAFRLEEQLLHRVLQRVDLQLEERLTDAVSAAVQQQLDIMLPRLRIEIEQVLRALVVDALAQELSENPRE